MAALREIFAAFGVEFDRERRLERGDRQVRRATVNIRALVQAAAGAFALRGFSRFIRATIDMGDELDKTSQQVGLTVDQLERLRYVGNLGGVASAEMANALGQLQRRADDAARGGTTTSEAFRRLGVDVRDSAGNLRNAHDLFLAVADGLHGLDNASERTALSMELMGRQGRRMLPMFADGAEGIRRMEDEFTRLVGGSLQEFVEVARDAQDDLTRFNVVMTSFRARLAVLFLPVLRQAVNRLSAFAQTFRDLTTNSRLAESALVALGIVAAGVALATIGMWGPILLVVAAAALLALVIDDLWVGIEGGDSVIARLVDSFFKAIGVGLTFADMVEAARTQLKWLSEPESLIPTINQLLQIAGAGFTAEEAIRHLTAGFQVMLNVVILADRYVQNFMKTATQAREAFAESFGALRPVVDFFAPETLGETPIARGARAVEGEQRRIGETIGPALHERVTGTVAGTMSGRPVDASSQLTVQVTGGAYSDPQELARDIGRRIREENERHARRIISALVPGGST